MEELLDAVASVVGMLSPERVQAIASRIRRTDASNAAGSLSGVVGTPAAVGVVDHLLAAWRATNVGAAELASMLLAAGHVFTQTANRESMELVWTGPTTPFVSARRTEQALLQVINAAEHTLFITSFVAYDVSTIVQALNLATARGVALSILLELSQGNGGTITFDAMGQMRTLVPAARLYAWREKADPYFGGRVHAKVAVADGRICFITSANLTGHAMEKNMEAGVLVSGGTIPRQLEDHLRALIETKVVSPA